MVPPPHGEGGKTMWARISQTCPPTVSVSIKTVPEGYRNFYMGGIIKRFFMPICMMPSKLLANGKIIFFCAGGFTSVFICMCAREKFVHETRYKMISRRGNPRSPSIGKRKRKSEIKFIYDKRFPHLKEIKSLDPVFRLTGKIWDSDLKEWGEIVKTGFVTANITRDLFWPIQQRPPLSPILRTHPPDFFRGDAWISIVFTADLMA